jgi:hypothetical protein
MLRLAPEGKSPVWRRMMRKKYALESNLSREGFSKFRWKKHVRKRKKKNSGESRRNMTRS